MPVVGVPLRPVTGKDGLHKLGLNRTYFDALENAGATVVPIPITRDEKRLRFHYELLDGLLLPGGADIEPGRYGVVKRQDCNLHVIPELDEVELKLAGWAMADGLPTLGICRGIQVLNVACGGTLWQDLQVEGAVKDSHDCEPRDSLVHGLEVEPGSLLAQALGQTHIRVNSLHHQAVRDLGSSLRASGCSSDGLIEGIELPGHRFLLGIQCHPEELARSEEWARRLFETFVSACNRNR